MASNLVQLQVPELKKDNYGKWCIQFKALFGSQDLWDIVSNGYIEPTPEQESAYTQEQKNILKDQRKKDKKALFLLYQGLEDDTFEKISEAVTSKEVWDKLGIIYKGVERVKRVRLQTLRSEFEEARMKEGETVSDYHSKLIGIVHQMRRNGETLDDNRVNEKLLRSLMPVFDYVIAAIEESKDLATMSTEELLGSLRVHELRIRKTGDVDVTSTEKALQSKISFQGSGGSRSRGRGGFNPRGRGGRGNSMQTRGTQYGEGRMTVQCWNCKQYGHYASECRNKNDKMANFAEGSADSLEEPTLLFAEGSWEEPMLDVNVADGLDDPQEEPMLHVAGTETLQEGNVWYLDSGASNHMSGRRDFFMELHEHTGRTVSLGDASKLQVAGTGKVIIYQKDGSHAHISDVYYVPNMRSNILSIGQLLEKGHVLHMEGEYTELRTRENRLIARVRMSTNRMFPLRLNTMLVQCLATRLESESEKWHLLKEGGMVQGLPNIDELAGVCPTCVLGKQTRQPFSTERKWRATGRLQLVHTDLCGPFEPVSIGGTMESNISSPLLILLSRMALPNERIVPF
ncbi:uncharacterized protein LOC119980235 [Tripterygium wilfordii]|uniref:uncharacterized protein LOC119980235 n=1 Tax=Tripterygium wilfordii TaxID=458696 RepID=UPI0018F7EE9F|nr:uncharacterized protein LOC119980235 [Tripterygium wilfordii]